MKSIKAKIIYYNIIKPTFDLIELFSINTGKSVNYSVRNSVYDSVCISVRNSIDISVRNSIRDNIK